MMRAQLFDITLTVRAPVLCAGLERKAWGWDVGFIRNEEERPVIPRDHIKGHVRQAMELLAARTTVLDDALLEDWLGRASPDNSNDEPRPGRVIFDDLELENDVEGESRAPYTRIRIDAETGTVKKGMLAFFEQIALPGAKLTFRGTLTLLADDEEAEAFADILSKALKLIPAVGAIKSAGFGEVVTAQAERREDASRASAGAAALPEKADAVTFEVTFDRPILVNAVHESDNLMVGSEVVPGGVIKGALAWLLGQEGRLAELSDALSNIVISHAFPLDSSGKVELAHPVPLCMASFKRAAGGYQFRCDLGLGGAGVVENGAAPFYPPDWKKDVFDQARKRLGQPAEETLARLQRTRVAIDYKSGAAKESQLFTEVAVSECIDGKRDEKRRWRFTVHRNGADEGDFRELVERIREGLFNIGRTNAAMTVAETRPAAEEDFAVTSFAGEDDTFALMLLTPAVMTDALALGESGKWAKDARDAYAEYWAQALPGAELVDFMASQRWAGRYLGIRFRPYGDDKYYPFMLTEPGSVFLLKGAAREDVERLLRTYLPHAPLNGKKPNWRASPFVPENGYGRVRCLTRAEIEGGRSDA